MKLEDLPPVEGMVAIVDESGEVWSYGYLTLQGRYLDVTPYACQYCGEPFEPVVYRWLCPHCKGKNTCCE